MSLTSLQKLSIGRMIAPHKVILRITRGDPVRVLYNKIMPCIGMFLFPGHKPTVSKKRLVVCRVGHS